MERKGLTVVDGCRAHLHDFVGGLDTLAVIAGREKPDRAKTSAIEVVAL